MGATYNFITSGESKKLGIHVEEKEGLLKTMNSEANPTVGDRTAVAKRYSFSSGRVAWQRHLLCRRDRLQTTCYVYAIPRVSQDSVFPTPKEGNFQR